MNDLFMILGEDLFSYFLIAIIYWCFNKRVGVLMAFHMSISSCILEFVPKMEPAWAFFIALLIIFPLYLILEFADKGYDRDRFLFYPGIVLYVYLFVTGEGSAYAAGSIGMLLGWYLERKTIQYAPVRSDKDRPLFVIRRFVPGALAILVFKEYVMRKAEAIIPEQLLPGVTGFAIMFFIIYLYPLLFDALVKRKYLSPSEKVYRAVVVSAAALIVVITLAGALNDGAEMYGEMLGIKREDAMEEADAFYIRRSRLFSEAGVWKKTGDLNYIPEGKELPVIAADGGYSEAADYGSLDAIKAAYDIGADAIYLPISATKDGVFVMRSETGEKTFVELRGEDESNASFLTLAELLTLNENLQKDLIIRLPEEDPGEEVMKAMYEVISDYHMADRVIICSNRYAAIRRAKKVCHGCRTMYRAAFYNADSLVKNYDSDLYAFDAKYVDQNIVYRLHEYEKEVYIFGTERPSSVKMAALLEADGIITEDPGTARIYADKDYGFATDHVIGGFVLPGFYDYMTQGALKDYVMQGCTRVDDTMIISAYDYRGIRNSVLIMADTSGTPIRTVNLGFRSHVGGISYDRDHGVLWVSGLTGNVKAINYKALFNEGYNGEILTSFDPELLNHKKYNVASFLTYDEGVLYVGSFNHREEGELRAYDVNDISHPNLISSMTIPADIQGITFTRIYGGKTMILTTSYNDSPSELFFYDFDESFQKVNYKTPDRKEILPPGAEQPVMTGEGLYVVFESAARPYRGNTGLPVDHVLLFSL